MISYLDNYFLLFINEDKSFLEELITKFLIDFYSFPQFKRETIEGYNISIISSVFQNHQLSLKNLKKYLDNR